MKSFAELIKESKNETIEFIRHTLYDQTYKTVECPRCRIDVMYYQFMMSGICYSCAQKEDNAALEKFHVEHQGDNMESSLYPSYAHAGRRQD